MRTLVADFEVLERLADTPDGRPRYLCRGPERLALHDPVMVTEVAVDSGRWSQLKTRLTQWAEVAADELLRLVEAGADQDPGGSGVYLATEHAPGGRLGDPANRLGPAERVRAIARAAQGMHALHEAGIAYGPVSLDSVLLTGRGAVLSPPALDSRPGLLATVSGWHSLVAVDPDLLGGEAPSRPSDIWSLGAALHMALSERPLYKGIDSDATVTAVQRVLFSRPEVDPMLPAAVSAAITDCLDPDPGARPASAAELAARLLKAVESL